MFDEKSVEEAAIKLPAFAWKMVNSNLVGVINKGDNSVTLSVFHSGYQRSFGGRLEIRNRLFNGSCVLHFQRYVNLTEFLQKVVTDLKNLRDVINDDITRGIE